jgi:hypothetical protein
MVTYVINRTDISEPTTNVEEKSINQSFSIALFGREKLEYGELMNENVLHLLENFACPPLDGSNPPTPDMARALDNTLQNAIDGQLWYNNLDEQLYLRRNSVWVPLSSFSEIAANYGTLAHGEIIPLPVSSTGETFTREECSWIVGPYNYPEGIDFMKCYSKTDTGQVSMQYILPGGVTLTPGIVNYMIVGIKGNLNQGLNPNDAPPSLSPTPTPGPTVTPTATFGITPTITPTGTPGVTATPANTPDVTSTPAQTPSPSTTILGLNTRLYIGPSPGSQAAGFGPYDHHTSTCGDLCDNTQATCDQFDWLLRSRAIERRMDIRLENISGGIPPYIVDYSGVTFEISGPTTTFMQFAGDPTLYPMDPLLGEIQWSGGTGPVMTGVTGDYTIMYVKQEIDNLTHDFNYPLDGVSYLGMYISAWGVVNLKDQSGQSRDWWIESNPTPVGGSNQNSPSQQSPIPRLTQTWSHYYDCSLCPGYCWDKIHIQGYP